MPHSVASDLGLHCVLRSVCPNILGYIGSFAVVQLKCSFQFVDKNNTNYQSLKKKKYIQINTRI